VWGLCRCSYPVRARRAIHPAIPTIQHPFSPLPCLILDHLIPVMLQFHVFIYTQPRSIHSKPRSNSSTAPESVGSHRAALSPSIALSLSNAFLFMDFRTLGPQWSAATPLQSTVCTLFPVQWRGRGSHCSPNFQTFQRVTFKRPLTPLECADPRFRALSPLECPVTKTAPCNPFRMRETRETRDRRGIFHSAIPKQTNDLKGPVPNRTSGNNFAPLTSCI